MAKRNRSEAAASLPLPSRPIDVSDFLTVLADRALPNMSREELKWVLQASELAEEIATRLGAAVEGLGCLVANDAHIAEKAPGSASGALQGADAIDAFVMVAHGLQAIAGLSYAGRSAAEKLLEPTAE